MGDFEPTNPEEPLPDHPESGAMSEPPFAESPAGAGAAPSPPPASPASPPDWLAATARTKEALRPRVRRLLSSRRSRWISAAALTATVTGVSVGFAVSPSATAAPVVARSGFAGGTGSGGGASNARSGPAAGGADGTVTSVSKSSFTLTTSAGQKVTIDEKSSTKYLKGTTSTSVSAVTKGESVLVLGTTNSTTITATKVIVGYKLPSSATAATVVPFQKGAPTTTKQVGQIPANFTQGSGTIVSGTAANKATEAALAAYPGGVVDRVVKLSNGEYNVHFIGVNWPHHVFESANFKVVGAL
jgi:hypothetical protein